MDVIKRFWSYPFDDTTLDFARIRKSSFSLDAERVQVQIDSGEKIENILSANFLLKDIFVLVGENVLNNLTQNQKDYYLMAAAGEGESSVESIALLLKAGANIGRYLENEGGALGLAYRNKHFDVAFYLYNAMSSEQVEKILENIPDLELSFSNQIEKIVLENRKKMFDLFASCILKEDNQTLIWHQPFELTAAQLSLRFPAWYAPRIVEDLNVVINTLHQMRNKRKSEEAKKAEEKQLFEQLYVANEEERILLIEKLGPTRYTYENCEKYLGKICAAQVFMRDVSTAVSSYGHSIFEQACSYLPTLKRKREERDEQGEDDYTLDKPAKIRKAEMN